MLNEEVRKFRLAVYCPRADDGTSLVRAIGPLGAMEKEDPRLELVRPVLGTHGQELTWDWLWRCDALFMQRPWQPVHTQLAIQASLMGLPIWMDWDDDYLSIHPSNPHYRQFAYEGAAEAMGQLVKLADVVTVSTEELKARIEDLENFNGQTESSRETARAKLEDKVRVVPNACMWGLRDAVEGVPASGPTRQRRVSWRGGHSHELDIGSVLKPMAELSMLPQFSKWEWCFLGDMPWQVTQVMPKERLRAGFGAEPWLYMEALARLDPWVHIVPLAENRFNKCKSNLAWLEASVAGAIVVAPDWPEWRRPGVMLYEGMEGFGRVLRKVMEGYQPLLQAAEVAASRAFIRENLTLEKVNEARWEILNGFAETANAEQRTANIEQK